MTKGTFKCSYTGGPELVLNQQVPESYEEFNKFVAGGESDITSLAWGAFTVARQNSVRSRMKESPLTGDALQEAAQGWSDAYRYAAGRSGTQPVDLSGVKVSQSVLDKLIAAGIPVLGQPTVS